MLPFVLSTLLFAQDFAAVDRAVDSELKALGAPGAAVAVVHGGRVVHLKGYGTSNVETGEKVTPDTLFRIGSTTKIFTAAAVLTLASEGRLDLSKPISTYAKGLDPSVGSLTMHQLLSHTSGLGDRGSGHGSHDDGALGTTMRSLKKDILELPAGEIFSYSSLGYWLAGFVLEEMSGKPFADAVADRIFTPLGMTGSTFRPLMAMTYPFAQQHAGGPGKAPTIIRPFADETATWPGGSAFTSARGLANFMIAFLNGKLSPQIVKLMSTPHAPFPGSSGVSYGYGVVTSTERGVRTLSHGGARIGFGSMVTMAPDQNAGVAVLANLSNAMLSRVAQSALETVVKFGPEEPETISTSEKIDLQNSTGIYAGGPIRVTLSLADGAIQVTMDGKSYPAKPLGGTRFSAEGPVGYFVLVPGPDGRTRYMHTNLRALKRIQ